MPSSSEQSKPFYTVSNPEGRWRSYSYDELIQRDKASLDIFWLRDTSLEDSASLPSPEILAQDILEDLEAALDQFSQIAEGLKLREAAVLTV